MWLRLLAAAMRRDPRRTAWRLLPVAVGTAVIAVWLGLAVSLEDRIAADLGAYGVNLVLYPADDLSAGRALGGGRLAEPATFPVDDLTRLKTHCFWAPNFLGHAPVLEGPAPFAGTQFAGLRSILGDAPVRGRWPIDGASEALAGSRTGSTMGSTVELGGATVRVVGLLETGESWDEFVWVDLDLVGRAVGLPGRAHRAYVRSMTTPEDVLAERTGVDPLSLPPEEFERWRCTPFASSVAYSIGEALPSVRAEPVWRVNRAQAGLFRRLRAVGLTLSTGAFLLALLAIASVLIAGVLERRREWATMRSIGGSPGAVRTALALEGLATGLLGGLLGAAAGGALHAWLAPRLLDAAVPVNLTVLAVAAALGATVSVLAHVGMAAAALRQNVPEALHEV